MPLPDAAAPARQFELVTYGYVPWSMSSSAPCAPSNSSDSPRARACVQQSGHVRDHRRQLQRERQRFVARLRERHRVALVVVDQHEVVAARAALRAWPRTASGSSRSCTRSARRAILSSYAGPMPRPVVPILVSPIAASRAWSSATWIGSTSGQAGEILSRERTSTPAASSSPISCSSAAGDSTTPLPTKMATPGRSTPDGMRRSTVLLAADDQRVAGVVAALEAHDARSRSRSASRRSCPCLRRPTACR